MLISLVILTWNRHKFLEVCLPALFANLSGLFEYEILVMDNGSTDLTNETLNKYKDRAGLTLLKNKKNLGLNEKYLSAGLTDIARSYMNTGDRNP